MMGRKIPVIGLVVVLLMASLMTIFIGASENVYAAPDAPEPKIFKQVIADIAENVSAANLYSYIYDLQNFTTRYYSSSKINKSADYIYNHFSNSTNLFVESQYLNYSGTIVRNVIATIPASNPNNHSVYIIGGHYDSICISSCDPILGNSFNNSETPAPGADDDGSGTAVTMETARVMSKYRYNATIVFAAWTTEELGLVGSDYYAVNAAQNNMDIDGMLQFDMVGNDPAGTGSIEITTDVPSLPIAEEIDAANTEYGLGLNINIDINPGMGQSDHASFWAQGFPAVMVAEGNFSPYWHTINDTIDNINMTLVEKVTKAGAAAIAELAGVFEPGVGVVLLDKVKYSVPETVNITLYDPDLNLDPGALDGATVTAKSDTEPLGEVVGLTETSVNSSVFTGSIDLTQVPTVGKVEVMHGDLLNVTYDDANPVGMRYATALIDNKAPVISNVTITPGAVDAVVTWTTDEDADSEVYYNTTIPLDRTVSDPDLVQAHSIKITGLVPSTQYYLDVASSDIAGNKAVDDNSGLHYGFQTLSGISVTPEYGYIGYVQEDEDFGNHFASERMIVGYSGFWSRTYVGGAQFNTSSVFIPPGATITNATLSFYMRGWIYTTTSSPWNLRLLHSSIDDNWTNHNYTKITGASINATVPPTFWKNDLVEKDWNTFWFAQNQYSELRTHVESGKVSFRVDGPSSGHLILDWATGFTGGGAPLSDIAPKLTITYSLTSDTEGPLTSNMVVNPNPTWGASTVTLGATISDLMNGSSNISCAEYFVDIDPGVGKGIPLAASDGSFDSVTEDVINTLNVSTWLTGNHTIYIRGRDQSNNWGPAQSIVLIMQPPDNELPFFSNVMADPSPQQIYNNVNISGNITDFNGIFKVWVNITKPNGTSNNQTMNKFLDSYYHDDTYDLLGFHNFTIWAIDFAGNWNSSSGQFEIIDSIPPSIVVSVDPAQQEVFNNVNVSAVIIDEMTVYDAWILISYPVGPNTNTTMNRPSATGFYYNDTYLNIGTHDFTILTNDTNGNWNSSSGWFNIVDTTLPSISTLNVVPDPQEVYQNVNISADLTDTYAFSGAWINIIRPNGSWLNTTMKKGSGDQYYLNQSYDLIGDYTFTIWVNDTSDNWILQSGGFKVIDLTLPNISSLNTDPNPQEVFLNLNVSATITDNYEMSTVKINITTPYGTSSNATMYKNGDTYWLDQIYNIIGDYDFTIWASDTSGNWNSMAGQFNIQDTTKPTISGVNVSPSPQEVHNAVNLSAIIEDNYQLDSAAMKILFPDNSLFGNESMLYDGFYDRYYFETSFNVIGNYTFEIWAKDTSGNWNNYMGWFLVQDSEDPTIIHVPVKSGKTGESFNITATVEDNYGIAGVRIIYSDVGGTEHNESMTLTDGQYHFSIPAQSNSGTISYKIQAVDGGGNIVNTADHNIILSSDDITFLLIALIILIVVVVLILMLLYFMRRKKAQALAAAEEKERAGKNKQKSEKKVKGRKKVKKSGAE